MARKKNLQHPIIAKVITDEKQETLDKLERNELAIYWENSFPILYIGNGAGKGTLNTSNLYNVFNKKYTEYFQNSTDFFRLYFNIIKPLSGKADLDSVDPGIYELKRGDTALPNCPLPETDGKLNVGGFLFMYKGSTQRVQIIIPVNSASDVFWYRCQNMNLEPSYGDWYQICDFSSMQNYVTATIRNTCNNGTIKNALSLVNNASIKQSVLPYYYFNSYGIPADLNTEKFLAAVYTVNPDDENVIRIQNVSRDTFLDWLNISYLDDSLNQAANTVFAAPSKEVGNPLFRKLVSADIPDLSETYAKKDHTHSKVTIPRVTKSANYLPGLNSVTFEEYSAGTAYNLPNNAWYHIITMEGTDSNYATQLALGMTYNGAYYRRKTENGWGAWSSLINTDTNTTYSTGTTTYSGTTKLYTSTGTNTDGTMTQAAIKSALDGKASSTHTHSEYLDNTNIYNNKGMLTVESINLMSKYSSGAEIGEDCGLGFSPIYGGAEVYNNRGQLNISSYGSSRIGESGIYNVYMTMLPCTAEVFFSSGSASGRTYDISIGAQGKMLKNIYAQNYLPESDKNKKEDVETISDKFISVFDKVNFVSYKFKNNNENDIDNKKHLRHHMGVLSQDVENLLKENNISNYDCSFIASSFFLNSSEGNKSTYAGINIKKFSQNDINYHYSENTYNWKHRNDDKKTGDYEVFNEITSIYPGFLDYEDYRKNLGYIMIEDISKLNHDQPPIVVNSIFIAMKDGTETTVNLNNEVLNYYYYPDLKTAETECVYDEDSDTLTINFKDIGEIRQNKAIFLKLDEVLNIDDIERIDFDLDLISECKIRLLPDGNYKNANVWDRFNNDQILYNYSFNYNELFVLASNVLQETRKEFKAYKEEKEKEITELKENYNSLLKRIEALENK